MASSISSSHPPPETTTTSAAADQTPQATSSAHAATDESGIMPVSEAASNGAKEPQSPPPDAATDQSHAAEPIAPTDKESEALGPAADTALPAPAPSDATVLSITLMLTTGARHPYKIDERYLRNRNVDARDPEGQFDPREISGYMLKELIWTDWRSEWEPRPASPSSIRLICMGRLLEDKSPLKDFPIKLNDGNVLHMTVKPADFLDDDETNTATTKVHKGHHVMRARERRARGEEDAGCRCVIL